MRLRGTAFGTASVEAGRARHSVRAARRIVLPRRARSDAPYLNWDPQPAMTDRLQSSMVQRLFLLE
jgi:hypothetical protein